MSLAVPISCKSCTGVSSKFRRKGQFGVQVGRFRLEAPHGVVARLRSSSSIVVKIDRAKAFRCGWVRTAVKVKAVILLGPLACEYRC